MTQLRAVLRAARGEHRLSLMFPMIESIDEFRFVRDLVNRAVTSLDGEGTQFQRNFRQGVLIETPSAVWDFERLLAEVDFASIGTNDLVQYLFAVERNAANVADFYQPAHPIVLRIIADLARKAADVGKPLGICGEVAADEDLLPVLVGLGLRDFSIAPGESSRVTVHLRALNEDTCTQLAQRCLAAPTAEEVLSLIGKRPSGRDAASSIQRGEAVDPVCGMRVRTDDTPYVLHATDGVHYFCSRQCLRGFETRGNGEQCF